MENPLRRALKEKGLSPKDLAIGSKTSIPIVYNALAGVTPLPKKVLRFLAEVGVDTVTLRKEYELYLDNKKKEVLDKIKQREE